MYDFCSLCWSISKNTIIARLNINRIFIIKDLILIMIMNEVVTSSKCRRNSSLNLQAILRWMDQNDKTTFENTKYPLYNILSRSMSQIKQFFLVCQSETLINI